ncbi:MAG: integration host factor subunit beta [Alphaproteobacteria bacterium CG_4_10_14_0_2_um_filter_63_37]|nr:MAG: integration host factor subunit beta [Proteobacteria bacterium CG1_02_64_396]PJA23541.1 MAG: integration host factor subunit beta [Alphaproteobacteria bacterium CG_4_10_14_0_2_um_filter_63_37]
MTKSELIAEVADQVENLSRKEVEHIVNLMFDIMVEAMKNRRRIELRGFGTFGVKERDARQGRNPKTGEQVEVPSKLAPFFKPGKALRERVEG